MDGIMQVGHLKPDTKGQLRWVIGPNQGFARIAWAGDDINDWKIYHMGLGGNPTWLFCRPLPLYAGKYQTRKAAKSPFPCVESQDAAGDRMGNCKPRKEKTLSKSIT